MKHSCKLRKRHLCKPKAACLCALWIVLIVWFWEVPISILCQLHRGCFPHCPDGFRIRKAQMMMDLLLPDICSWPVAPATCLECFSLLRTYSLGSYFSYKRLLTAAEVCFSSEVYPSNQTFLIPLSNIDAFALLICWAMQQHSEHPEYGTRDVCKALT